MDATVRFELTGVFTDGLANRCLRPLGYVAPINGAPEEGRTPKIWFLKPTRMPIPSLGRQLVLKERFEPSPFAV